MIKGRKNNKSIEKTPSVQNLEKNKNFDKNAKIIEKTESYEKNMKNIEKTQLNREKSQNLEKNIKIQEKPQNPHGKPAKTIENDGKVDIFDEYLKILEEVFESMDDDGDGIISSDKIDLSSVDPGFLEIIQDVLLKVDEEKSLLDFQRFLDEIEENKLEVKIHNVSFIPKIIYSIICL